MMLKSSSACGVSCCHRGFTSSTICQAAGTSSMVHSKQYSFLQIPSLSTGALGYGNLGAKQVFWITVLLSDAQGFLELFFILFKFIL